jgi:signal transduction histidine kinase
MKGSDSRALEIAVKNEGANCLVDVRDAGCGIAKDDWERVFERHYTTKAGGGGFGLFYSREELAKFSGKIYVLESSSGEGTTIRVVLRRSS